MPQPPNPRTFHLALCQLANLGSSKSQNISIARQAVSDAVKLSPRPELVVLPEIWNSPYAVSAFREYSEEVPNIGGSGGGETVKAMREMAKSNNIWLIGGEFKLPSSASISLLSVLA
jgi:omega-amidase